MEKLKLEGGLYQTGIKKVMASLVIHRFCKYQAM